MQRLAIICLLSLSGWMVSNAQNLETVNLAFNDLPVDEAIQQFSSQSGYHFAYNPDILQQHTISVNLENERVDKAVEKAFSDYYSYKIRGSYIILLPKSETQKLPKSEESQVIKGEVREEGTNKVLDNVSIYEVNTLKPVLTDESGSYEIDVSLPEDMAFIAISKENYQDTVIQVKKNSFWSVTLKKKEIPALKKVSEEIQGMLNNNKVQTHANNVNLTERRPVHLSLTPGISTNGFLSGQFTNKSSINIIAGYSYALEGVEFGGFLNMERSYVQGFQASGGLNINGDYMKGIQAAGFSNITLTAVDGWQLAGFSNHAGTLDGVQMSGAINTTKSGEGFQAAGFANWNNGNFHGTQAAGAINWSGDRYQGVQVSGFFNYAKMLSGVQIGIINISDSVSSGFMLGVINWARNGLHNFEVSTNDITPYNLSFKSGVYPFYTILRAGINPQAQFWDYGMGLGSMHFIGKRAFIDFEGTQHVIQALDQGYINGINFEARLQARFGYKVAKHFQIIGGPVFHFYHLKPDNFEDLTFADRFGKNPLFESRTSSKITKGWVGYELAVRF